jgi:FixJ family two-component response regulator
MAERTLISIVDDDLSVRESLPDLLRQFGFTVHAFSSAAEFLASEYLGETRCLILDVAMPVMNGPELQRELARRHRDIPIVFITATRDARIRPRLLRAGAVDCLFKPFNRASLLQAVNAAINTN